MSDLIDRSEFLKGFSYHAPEERFTPSEVAYLLGKAPTVEAVAVVRCGDCKLYTWDDLDGHVPTMDEYHGQGEEDAE